MIEQQSIKGKDVWVKVKPYHVQRSNLNIIPTEYFTASYYFQEPPAESSPGEAITDENGDLKLFESPVAALSYARKKVEGIL